MALAQSDPEHEIERLVRHGGGKDAAGCAAREVTVELVTGHHAAAMLLDQLLHRDPGRRQMNARFPHAARNRKGTQTLAPVTALRSKPLGAFLEDLAHPVERLHVVLERRATE